MDTYIGTLRSCTVDVSCSNFFLYAVTRSFSSVLLLQNSHCSQFNQVILFCHVGCTACGHYPQFHLAWPSCPGVITVGQDDGLADAG